VTGSWTGCTVGGPIAGDTVTIQAGHTITITANAAAATLTINTGSPGGTLNAGAFTLTLSGATSVAAGGALNITGVNTKTFTGNVQVDGVWNETAASAVTFGGNLTNNATTWTALGGVHLFSGAAKIISGTTATVIPSVSVSGTVQNNNVLTVATLLTVAGTLTNIGTVTATTALSGAGTFVNGDGVATGVVLNIGAASAITGLTASAANNTVNYTGAAQTVKVTTYNDLNLNGSGAKTFAVTTINGNLSLGGTATASIGANLTIGGTLTVNGGTTFTVPASSIGVTGNTIIAGTLSLTTNSTVAKNFTGTVTVQNFGILDLQRSIPIFSNTVTVQNGGTMRFATNNTGTKTFNGAVIIDSGGTMLANIAGAVALFNGDVTVNGTWNEAATFTVGFAGDLTNNATSWTASTLAHTFSGATKTISGTTATIIPSVSVSGTVQNNNVLTVATLLTVAGTLTNIGTVTATTALSGGGTFVNGDTIAAAVLNIGAASAITFLTADPANSTVNYTGGAAQTVKATTYNVLNLSGAGAKTTNTTGVAVNSTLTVSTGTTFTVAAFPLSVTGLTTLGGTLSLTSATGAKSLGAVTAQSGGILDLQASSPTIGGTVTVQSGGIMRFATAAGGTKTFNGTVTIDSGGTMNASVAAAVNFNADVTNNGTWNETAAAVMSFTGDLTNNGTSWTGSTGVHTFSGAGKNISGSLAVAIPNTTVTGTYANVNTLTVSTALAGAGTLTNGNGVTAAVLNIGAVAGSLTLANLNASPANNTVNYTLAGAQTIKVPTTFYQAVGLSGSGAKTAGGALDVRGTFTIGGTATFAGGTSLTHNFGGSWVVDTAIASSPFTFVTSSTINFNTPGTPAATSFDGTTTQTTAFNNVNVNNTSGFSVNDNISASGNLTVAANVTLTPGAANIISGVGGTLTGPGAGFGTVRVTRTAATADFSSQYTIANKTLDFLTVEYLGAAQTVSAISYTGNLTINNASGPTLAAGTTTVGKTLTLTAGTLTVGARTLVLNGPTIAGTPANLATISTSNLTFGGSSSGVNVPSSVTQLNNLTVNNSNGITLNSSPTVNGTLTFTTGNISAGSNTVIIPAAGTVSRTSGHVIGNLQKNVATGASVSRTYEIGDANAYSPILITFTSVGTAGNLIAKTTSGEHPDVANSLIDTSKNVNRYWTLTNPLADLVFTDYSATTTYASGSPVDLDASVDATTFGIGKADSCDGSVLNCTWTYPTIVGTPTTTSAQASGMTSFSHVVVGRKIANFLVEAAGGGNIPTQTQDTPFSIKITARDAANNTVTGFTGTAQISSGSCTLSGGSGITANFVNGVLASHSVTISSPASCTVTSTRTGGAETGTSNSFTVLSAVTAFNGCETASPACTPGVADYDRLFTKLANNAFTLDLVALKSGGTLSSTFAGTATVDLLANSTVQGVGANNCPASQTAVISLGSSTFSGGRKSAISVGSSAFSGVAPNYSVYRDVRVRVTCDATNCPPSGLTWCSADNFAVRPQTFTISAPVLTNVAQTGTPKAAAGSDFTLTATAVAGYDGTASLDRTASKVFTHVGVGDFTTRLRDSAGGNAITFPAATIGTGAASNTVQYHDAGNVGILANGIVDSTFTAVDDPVKDCVGGSSSNADDDSNANTGLKYGCNIANQSNSSLFGRFYPSSYALSSPSVTAACAADGFTYMGHAAMGLGYTISAKSLGNPTAGDSLTLTKYTSGYATLATVGVLAENGNTATDLSGSFSPSLAYSAGNWLAGDYAVTGSIYAFARPASTPSGPYDSFYIGAGVTDADGALLNGLNFKLGDVEPLCTAGCTHKLLSLSATKIRFGRMRLLGAVGSESLNLPMPMRTEYWTGTGFATNTLDNCTTLAPTAPRKFVLFDHKGGITTGNMVTPTTLIDGNVSTNGTFVNGAGSLTLLKPSAPTAPGSVRVCLDLDAAGGDASCVAPVTPTNLTHLQGKWSGSNYDKDPSARAAFGLYGSQPRQFIFLRESY